MEDVDEPADQVAQATDGSLSRLAEHGLEPGEGFVNWHEVRAVMRKETQGCTGCFDPFLHGCPFVAGGMALMTMSPGRSSAPRSV